MFHVPANHTLPEALDDLRRQYALANPKSDDAHRQAMASLPGGNTRSVLHFEPFPLTLTGGKDAEVFDLDGHGYLDCVGEFSAGLYGHSEPVILKAITDALQTGIVLGGPTVRESKLAAAISARIPSMELLRFCNSGTEANLMAIVTAIAVTGRRRILAFHEAYHGGVLVFSSGGARTNVPFDTVLADYNDLPGTCALIDQHRDTLACVIVEPVLGAGGNIPGTAEFLRGLREATARHGILLIFDEVKTSRSGQGGVQGLMGVRPDLTTLGKYVGGGLPTGAFGGRRDIMERYDPHRTDGLRHAGTYNNNVLTMAAGLAGWTEIFTASRADAFLDRCENLRIALNAEFAGKGLPMQITGLGSMWTVHFTDAVIRSPKDVPAYSRQFGQLMHMALLLGGILVASRGDLYLSLPMSDQQFEKIHAALIEFSTDYGPLLRRAVEAG